MAPASATEAAPIERSKPHGSTNGPASFSLRERRTDGRANEQADKQAGGQATLVGLVGETIGFQFSFQLISARSID